jgi:uncharacterized protein with GYD domain
MARFITTIKMTSQGLTNIQDTCERADAFKAAAKKRGCKVTDIFWTMGVFDGVLIFEAPDDLTASALLLQLESLGNVHTQTARAFTAAEMETILKKSAS